MAGGGSFVKERVSNQRLRSNQGFLVLSVSVALMVVALVALSMQRLGTTTARTVATANAMEKARMAAEAGLAHGVRNIREPAKSSPANICNQTYAVNQSTGLGPTWLSHTFASGPRYEVKLGFSKNANGEPGELELRSTGIADGVSVTLSRGFSSLKYAYYSTQDCADSARYLCTLFPTKDKHACFGWDCSGDDQKIMVSNGTASGPNVVTGIDFDLYGKRSQFDDKRIVHARMSFNPVWLGTNSSGQITFHSLMKLLWGNWSEDTVTYSDFFLMRESSPTASWTYRGGVGTRWVDVTPLARRWVSPPAFYASRGILFWADNSIDWLGVLSKEETVTSAIRANRPRLDLRPRLEVFYLPLGNC